MNTEQDEISTMVYELYLLGQEALTPPQREWIIQLWYRPQIRLSMTQQRRLFLLHRAHVQHCKPILSPSRRVTEAI